MSTIEVTLGFFPPIIGSVATRYRKTRLDALIEEATVDAYNDNEKLIGFFTMIEDDLAMPFEVVVLGVTAKVVAVDETGEALVAVCRRGKTSLRVKLTDLPHPVSEPDGWEWVEAYREWARGQS